MDELDEARSLRLKELLADYFEKRRDLDMSKYEEEQEDEDETFSKLKVCVLQSCFISLSLNTE